MSRVPLFCQLYFNAYENLSLPPLTLNKKRTVPTPASVSTAPQKNNAALVMKVHQVDIIVPSVNLDTK